MPSDDDSHAPFKKDSGLKDQIGEKTTQLFSGFSKLSLKERYKRLTELSDINSADVRFLKNGGMSDLDLADKCIENSIGYFQMPLGVAVHFVIDGRPVPIPMAVEETSIIASACKTAKWIKEHGSIKTSSEKRRGLGQIQIHNVKDFENLKKVLKTHEKIWVGEIHEKVIPGLFKRGGGVLGFELRKIPHEKGEMAVIHVFINTLDAMGANIINQVCEYLKTPLEKVSQERVSMCIVSNLAVSCLAEAKIEMRGIDPDLAEKIEAASIFAEKDPYRAATSNKGVMNGIDAVLMATGNDWRAVEAGVHAYSVREGRYQSITRWRFKDHVLHGSLSAPLMMGVVGGMTKLHPTAKMCMKMMGVSSAQGLARICAAVGLVQNLGALRALTTVGIIEGHMKLHIKNLTKTAGADEWEFPIIQKHLETLLHLRKRISLSHAVEALQLIREKLPRIEDFTRPEGGLTQKIKAASMLKDLRQKYRINKN